MENGGNVQGSDTGSASPTPIILKPDEPADWVAPAGADLLEHVFGKDVSEQVKAYKEDVWVAAPGADIVKHAFGEELASKIKQLETGLEDGSHEDDAWKDMMMKKDMRAESRNWSNGVKFLEKKVIRKSIPPKKVQDSMASKVQDSMASNPHLLTHYIQDVDPSREAPEVPEIDNLDPAWNWKGPWEGAWDWEGFQVGFDTSKLKKKVFHELNDMTSKNQEERRLRAELVAREREIDALVNHLNSPQERKSETNDTRRVPPMPYNVSHLSSSPLMPHPPAPGRIISGHLPVPPEFHFFGREPQNRYAALEDEYKRQVMTTPMSPELKQPPQPHGVHQSHGKLSPKSQLWQDYINGLVQLENVTRAQDRHSSYPSLSSSNRPLPSETVGGGIIASGVPEHFFRLPTDGQYRSQNDYTPPPKPVYLEPIPPNKPDTLEVFRAQSAVHNLRHLEAASAESMQHRTAIGEVLSQKHRITSEGSRQPYWKNTSMKPPPHWIRAAMDRGADETGQFSPPAVTVTRDSTDGKFKEMSPPTGKLDSLLFNAYTAAVEERAYEESKASAKGSSPDKQGTKLKPVGGAPFDPCGSAQYQRHWLLSVSQ